MQDIECNNKYNVLTSLLYIHQITTQFVDKTLEPEDSVSRPYTTTDIP